MSTKISTIIAAFLASFLLMGNVVSAHGAFFIFCSAALLYMLYGKYPKAVLIIIIATLFVSFASENYFWTLCCCYMLILLVPCWVVYFFSMVPILKKERGLIIKRRSAVSGVFKKAEKAEIERISFRTLDPKYSFYGDNLFNANVTKNSSFE